MLSSSGTAFSAACRSTARRAPASSVRQLSTRAALPRTNYAAWIAATALTGSVLGYSVYQLKPELLPAVIPEAHAESEPSLNYYIDPNTSTPFPTSITSPDGVKLALVGTGVRTVSFLGIKVYAGGFYVEEAVLKNLSKVEGFESFNAEKLLPPFPKSEDAGIYGEALIGKLLDVADVSVMIVPLRNTNLPHLRDGFSRALVARMKLPHVSGALSEEQSESAGTALTELKGYFPGRTLPKGSPLELYFSSKKTVLFQMRSTKDAHADVLGTLTHPILAKQLLLSYFSDSLETSPELRKSTALGLAGEPRHPSTA
ncbi:chalcone-flavanone isomerase-domain-containing protein [Leucosporidium creatinivorum]|uniref:Chalcone-flavanone isomerase-domain-containing protein n=1 Tax=Leucosporidium creatinivorum TaxID=106004 RepID=A0A1Y2EWW4_9BASI|nr:chalcone-flavanone isomerase-domain-containing protein [Leucosporidium creatinivorum]